MSGFTRIILSTLMALACAGLACTAATVTPDAGAVATYIARTMTAASGLTASALPSSPLPQTPSQTFTAEPPTFTPTPVYTATTVFTVTPLTPSISVSVATNCRSGPGKIYNMEGALLVGETAQVLAHDPTGNYWYIPNPDSPGKFCWVWGEYATLTGNTSVLPIYTPPPTPTATATATPAPDFTAEFDDLERCSNAWWADLGLQNTGSFTFKSLILRITDRDTEIEMTSYQEDFVNRNGCSSTTTWDIIESGRSFSISSPPFDYDFDDHRMRAKVTLCTEPAQGGTCITRVVNFTP